MSQAIIFALLSTVLGAVYTVSLKLLIGKISMLDVALVETAFLIFFFGLLEGWKIKDFSIRSLKYLFVGSLCHGCGTLFFYLSLKHLMPLDFSFLGRNQATIAVLLGMIFLKERPTSLQWLAILTALTGAFLFTYHDFYAGELKGIGYAICFCVSLALRSFFLKKSPKIPVRTQMFWGFVFGFMIVMTIAYYTRSFLIPPITIDFLRYGALVCLSSWLCIGMGISLYFSALKKAELSIIGSIRSISPLFVALLSMALFSYEWTLSRIIGAFFSTVSIGLFLFEGWLAYRSSASEKRNIDVLPKEKILET